MEVTRVGVPTAENAAAATTLHGELTMSVQTITGAREKSRLTRCVGSARRRSWLLLSPFLLVFLLVPLLAPYNENLYDDEGAYVGLAKLVAHGHLLTGRDTLVGGGNAPPNLWFGPGLPLVLAPLVKLHASLTALRLVGPICLFAALLVFFALLRLFVPLRAALLGSLAFALYLPFYTVIAFVHTEPLAVLFVTSTLYLAVRYEREGRLLQLVLAAAAFAGLVVTRVAYGWILSVLLVAAAVSYAVRRDRRRRRLVLVLALAFVLCIPWLAYTRSVTGKTFYWGSSGALSLYWMSSPSPRDRGDWHGANDVFRDPGLAAHRTFFRRLVGLDLNAQNRVLEHRAWRNIRGHPFKFARNVVDNISRMWLNRPYSFKSARATSLVYALPNVLVLAGLALAAALTLRRRRRLDRLAVEIGAFALTAFGLHALLAAYPRMLIPLVPIALLAIVTGVSRPAGAARV
jgi:4-amino-4-deoxy-L-arabinose transferase-like glycosyltransferase